MIPYTVLKVVRYAVRFRALYTILALMQIYGKTEESKISAFTKDESSWLVIYFPFGEYPFIHAGMVSYRCLA
jgi:hypothetical protein